MKRFTKKIAFFMALVMVFALTSAVSANAADAYSAKFTFNDACTLEGWTVVTEAYSAEKGYGFDNANNTYTAGVSNYQELQSTSNPLYVEGAATQVCVGLNPADPIYEAICKRRGEAKADPEVAFYVDLPAGTYDVTVYAGGNAQNATYDFNHIYIHGEEIVRDCATDPWNSEYKDAGAIELSSKNLEWNRTITLTEATKVEIKASNPTGQTMMYKGAEKTDGGRAYMQAIVINEVVAEAPATPAVPKDGESMTVAYIAALAVVSAGAAVLVSKKRKEA